MDLTYFNPLSQTQPDFLANFVARQNTLDFFLRQLRLDRPGESSRHHLIVAPRGYGKTSLLRRIAIAVRTEPALQSRFIALTFREEQHNVISLDVFWRNCLQSLLESREDEEAPAEEIEQLDAAWDKFSPRQGLKRSEQDGEPAWYEFQRRCEELKRRPLLLIDNLDALLAGLEPNHQWALRRTLQSADGPMLVAAASRYPGATSDPNAAFHDFFRVQTLDKLSDREVMQCLRSLALRRDERGRAVLVLLDRQPGRVAALNALAGGNPRTLNVLYSVLESHMSADVLWQLSAMLDIFTVSYQARTEELPMQGRAVFDALALNWNPMTAASLSEATGLDTSAVSSQLSRLEKAGFVESVALSRRVKGRNGYQVSERFFNIWYLMRNGPRRRRNEIKFLTIFLQSCFSYTERRSIARAALGGDEFRPGFSLAIAGSLGRGDLRDQLLVHAQYQSQVMGQTEEYDALIEEMLSQAPIDKRRIRVSVFEDVVASLDRVVAKCGDATDLALRERVARALLMKAHMFAYWFLQEDAIDIYDLVIERLNAATEPRLREYLTEAQISKANRLVGLERGEEAIALYDDIIGRLSETRDPQLRVWVALAFVRKSISLDRLGRFEEAIATCDQVLRRMGELSDSRVRQTLALALLFKANYLDALERDDQAIGLSDEIASRFASEHDSRFREIVAMALLNKASGLERTGACEQASDVYEEIVERFGDAAEPKLGALVTSALYRKGRTRERMGRLAEAEVEYRRAVEFNPRDIDSWYGLGQLLLDYTGDLSGAREAFTTGVAACSRISQKLRLHAGLAYVLALHDHDEAGAREHIRRAAIRRSTAGRLLLEVLPIVSGAEPARWDRAFAQIGKAFESGNSDLWTDYVRELQRLISYVLMNGQGAAFKNWMDDVQYSMKFAPFYHAVVAVLDGEDHLLRINPEVREPAARIHEGIARMVTLYGKKARSKRAAR